MDQIALPAAIQKLSVFLSDYQNKSDATSGLFDEELIAIGENLDKLKSLVQVGEGSASNSKDTIIELAYRTEDLVEDLWSQQDESISSSKSRRHNRFKILSPVLQLRSPRHRERADLQTIRSNVDALCKNLNIPNPAAADSGDGIDRWWSNSLTGQGAGDDVCSERVDDLKKVIEVLIDEKHPELTTVSVVGIAGLGKTTLAKRAYNDQKVKERFSEHAWVAVAQASSLEDIYHSMIRQFKVANPVDHKDSEGVEQLSNAIANHLKDKRYVVVLDAVWHVNAWEGIKFALPDNEKGSRIIITTRVVEVASAVQSRHYVCSLQFLSDQDAWSLFCSKRLGWEPNKLSSDLEQTARNLVSRCLGVPLTVITLAGLMSTDKEKTEWDRIRESLGSEMESDLIPKTTMSLLSLNYEKLSSSLKCCFMYLGMFPSNISIKCSRLIRLWIANEFVTGTGKSCRTLEEVGEEYMNELVHRNLVEAAGHYDDGRIKSCRVHNRVHEFILSKYLDENFGVIVNDHQDITTLSALIRRLSIQRSFENYPRKSDLSHLRCLHIYGSSLEDIKYDFRHLLVLDLEGTPLKKLPSEIGDLVYLKYLGLRKTKISALPKSATKLTKLETLDLKGTLISKLPDFISELQKLRHLLLPYNSEEKQGIELAQQVVAKLDQLQEISNVQVSQDSATYLQTLTKLKSISVVVRRQEDGKKLSSGSQKDDKQVSSTKQNDGGESSATVEMTATENAATSKGFACVQVLCLKGDLEGNLPSWIGMITATLVRLCLRDSGLEADPFELLLKGLDSLEVLTLNQAFKGEKLVLRSDLLGKLKVMKLINLEHLTSLELEDGAVPALEKLKIVGCTKLKAIPPAILYHKQLKVLHFYEMQNPDLLMGIKPKVPLISWYPEWTVVDLQ